MEQQPNKPYDQDMESDMDFVQQPNQPYDQDKELPSTAGETADSESKLNLGDSSIAEAVTGEDLSDQPTGDYSSLGNRHTYEVDAQGKRHVISRAKYAKKYGLEGGPAPSADSLNDQDKLPEDVAEYPTAATLETHPDMHDPVDGLHDKIIDDWAKAEFNGNQDASQAAQDKIQERLVEAFNKGEITNDEVSGIIDRLHDLKEMNKAEREAVISEVYNQLSAQQETDSQKATIEAYVSADGETLTSGNELYEEIERLVSAGDIDRFEKAFRALKSGAQARAAEITDQAEREQLLANVDNYLDLKIKQFENIHTNQETVPVPQPETQSTFLKYLESVENSDDKEGVALRYDLLKKWGYASSIEPLSNQARYRHLNRESTWEEYQKRAQADGFITGSTNPEAQDADEAAENIKLSRIREVLNGRKLSVYVLSRVQHWRSKRQEKEAENPDPSKKLKKVAALGIVSTAAIIVSWKIGAEIKGNHNLSGSLDLDFTDHAPSSSRVPVSPGDVIDSTVPQPSGSVSVLPGEVVDSSTVPQPSESLPVSTGDVIDSTVPQPSESLPVSPGDVIDNAGSQPSESLPVSPSDVIDNSATPPIDTSGRTSVSPEELNLPGSSSGAAESTESVPDAVKTFTVEVPWEDGNPTAESWAKGLGIPEDKIPEFLREVMGDDWKEIARNMQVGDSISATPEQIARFTQTLPVTA